MLRRLHAANRHVPLVTVPFITDGRHAFSVQQIREASPRTKINARIFTGRDYHGEDIGGWDMATRQHGRDYFERNKVLITPDVASADYVQIRDLNEPGIGRGFNDWLHGILDGATASRIKLMLPTFSVGNPGIPGESRDDAWYWSDSGTHALLRRVRDEGHGFGLHQYYPASGDLTDASWAYRHRLFYPKLPADLRTLKLWLVEFGQSKEVRGTPADRSDALYETIFRSAQRELAKGPGDPDVAFWTLGDSGGWGPDRLEGVLDVYERVVME